MSKICYQGRVWFAGQQKLASWIRCRLERIFLQYRHHPSCGFSCFPHEASRPTCLHYCHKYFTALL